MKNLPLIETIKSYRRDLARDDLIAAVTVTIMLVPQSLAYAMLAGLPPEVGLYSSILPLIGYALIGSSGSLAVGPVAVLALMTGATIADVSATHGYSAIEVSITLALLSGLILFAMGLLRMGFIVNFISRSVTEGFVTASAILIAFSQLKHIFAVDVEGHNLYSIASSLLSNMQSSHIPTLILGAAVLCVLLMTSPVLQLLSNKLKLGKHFLVFTPRLAPAVMVIITILLIHFTALGEMDIKTVGFIPNGIPRLHGITMDTTLLSSLFLPAALLSIIGYIESITVASRFAAKTRSTINPNNELLGLGAANMGSGISGGMPVTGGFSRSVVNYNAGSKTPISSVWTAIFIAIIVSGMMGFLEQLPKATLAAAIIAAVIGLIDIKRLKETWHYSKADFGLMIITILTTLFLGVEIGISTGIVLSICLHLYLTSKPHIAIVGQVPGTEHFRNVLRHDVKTTPEIIGIRIDERLYFANASYLEQEVLNIVSKNELIEHCILLFSSVSDIDASALESLETINTQLEEMGVKLHLSEVKGPVMDKLNRTSLVEKLKDRIHLSHYQAVNKLSQLYDNCKAESDVYETNFNQFK